MGLDAAVYKKPEELPAELRPLVRLVSMESGEIEYATPEIEAMNSLNSLFAVDIHLGNAALIGWMGKQFSAVFPELNRPLLAPFVSGESRSGTVIPVSQLIQMDLDLKTLRANAALLDADALNFLNSVKALIDAAKQRSNPIVFL